MLNRKPHEIINRETKITLVFCLVQYKEYKA